MDGEEEVEENKLLSGEVEAVTAATTKGDDNNIPDDNLECVSNEKHLVDDSEVLIAAGPELKSLYWK